MKWHLPITAILAAILLMTFACGERAATDDGDDDAEDVIDDDDDDDDIDDDLGDDDTEMSDDEIQALCEEYREIFDACGGSDVVNYCEDKHIAICIVNYVADYLEMLGVEDVSLVDCSTLRHEVFEECL